MTPQSVLPHHGKHPKQSWRRQSPKKSRQWWTKSKAVPPRSWGIQTKWFGCARSLGVHRETMGLSWWRGVSRGFINFLHADDSCRHCEQLGLQRFVVGNGHAAERHRCLELGTQYRNIILCDLRGYNYNLTSCWTHFQHFSAYFWNMAQTVCSWNG